MQFQLTSVLLALGLVGLSTQYKVGDTMCYPTADVCDNASTNSGCTGCTYYASESIPYCCTITTDPNSK